jgi:ubiquinone biosynthesis protein UbiJ
MNEWQRQIVLLLNQVLTQEPQATGRLVRQKGRVVIVQWHSLNMRLVVTSAGLLDLSISAARPDLVLTLTEESPIELAQHVLRGDKPAVRIEGDVQLAAEVNWLVDHVRWDLEEDLSRLLGDVAAHTVGELVRSAAKGLRDFVVPRASGTDSRAPV